MEHFLDLSYQIFIKYVCRVPLRMTDETCEVGDYAIHGEEPYTFDYYNRKYIRIAGFAHEGPTDAEKAISGLRNSYEVERNYDPNGNDIVITGQDPEAIGRNSNSQEITPTKEAKQE